MESDLDDKMTETITSKREVYYTVYQDITSIQESYKSMIIDCSVYLQQFNAAGDDDSVDSLQRNIAAAEESIKRLERIKYFASIAILTEGAAVEEDELTTTIGELDTLLEIAEQEVEVDDNNISSWAVNKKDYLDNVRNAILQILNDKLWIKVRRERLLYQ